MCGIAGIIEELDVRGLEYRWAAAASEMHSRGPDYSNYKISRIGEKNCLLGHKRLEIVDRDRASNQPMERGTVSMVFNGEIYNHFSIREKLKQQGVSFATLSDTEVLIQSFIAKGTKCFLDFDGMWAVAFVDYEKKRLTLSRDFFGEKPLYYYFDNKTFAFASNIKALNELLGGKLSINTEYFNYFVRSGYAPPNCTILNGVKRLEASQELHLDIHQMKLQCFETQRLLGEASSLRKTVFSMNRFEEVFSESLDRRLSASVPVGLMLSGGIDSSYIAAISKVVLGRELDCFTIKYGHGSEVETQRAKEVARKLNLPHQVIDIAKKDLKDLVRDSIPSMDEPISDVAFPLMLHIVGSVPDSVRVLLTGDGADELFLSYLGYQKPLQFIERENSIAGEMAIRVAKTLSSSPYDFRRIWRKISSKLPISAMQYWEVELQLLNSMWKSDRLSELASTPQMRLDRLYENAYRNDLSEYLLVKSDRASMAHSKEFRTPFLNKGLLNYVNRCDFDSLQRGNKKYLKERLNVLIGKDLAFEKRGMFAGGEKIFSGIALSTSKELSVPVPKTPQERYRCFVLQEWLAFHNKFFER